MDVSYQLAAHEDIEKILSMMESFYAIDGYPFDERQAKQNLLEFISSTSLGRLWLIIANAEIVGYVILTFGYSFEYGGRDAFIDELYLEAELRSKGIGTATMSFLENEALKLQVRTIHLEVESHNKNATKLYTNQGYKSNNRTLLSKTTTTLL